MFCRRSVHFQYIMLVFLLLIYLFVFQGHELKTQRMCVPPVAKLCVSILPVVCSGTGLRCTNRFLALLAEYICAF